MSATALTGVGAGANIYYGDGSASGDFRIQAGRLVDMFTDAGGAIQIFNNGGTNQIDISSGAQFRLGGFTGGSILFMSGIQVAQDNANFFWDDSNNRLGIGTNSPNATLEVSGTTRVTDLSGVGNRMVIADADGDLSTQAIPSGGGLTPTTQTTNYTAADSDFVICNVTTSLRVTLPAASAGAVVGIKYASQSAPTDVCDILTPSAGVTIDGTDRSSTALVLPSLNTYYELISDGTNWFIK